LQVEWVLGDGGEWLAADDALRRCAKASASSSSAADLSSSSSSHHTKVVTSNTWHPGPVDVEHRLAFTALQAIFRLLLLLL
jgi:hypothetical protein